MKEIYQHPLTRKIKEVKIGYSFTTLFFGFWPALFRGDFKYAGITFGASFVAALILQIMGFGETMTLLITSFGWAIWANFYNILYREELINQGYEQLQ